MAKGKGDGVAVRITKFGDGLVSTGQHIAGEGDVMAKTGAILTLAPDIAAALEKRGYAEIQDAPPGAAP